MENANKAIIMAASTLIGVMLLTLFAVVLKNISIWPQAQEELKEVEQVSAFNAEYEVYRKSAMYGVDVISCLNKAYNNNKKYVEGGNFFNDGGYREDYRINVSVKLKTPLTESITVLAMKKSSNGQYIEGSILGAGASYSVKNKNYMNIKLNEIFKINDSMLTDFEEDNILKYNMSNTFTPSGTYNLVDTSISDEDNILMKLMNHSNNQKQIIKNEHISVNSIFDLGTVPQQSLGWTTATWTTYLYSFKQKKFKCNTIEYNQKTGLINKLVFEEI